MAWWWWVLLWIGLLAGAAGVFALIGRSLWRKAVALARELGTAADRFGAVSEGLQQLAATQTDEPAVFTSASQLRQERILAGRRDGGRRAPGPDSAHQTRGSQKPRQSVR